MTDRAVALRRLDRTALLAMLTAGLGAQVAMWTASHRVFYLVAAVATVAVTVLTQAIAGPPSRRRRRFTAGAIKIVACAALVTACGSGVVGTALQASRPPSTATAIGALLVIAHLVHASTVTSRRESAAAAPLVAMMLLQVGFATRDALPAVPFAVALCGTVTGLAAIHRAELIERAGAVVLGTRSALRLGLARLGGVAALAAVVFGLLPNSTQLTIGLAAHRGSTSETSDAASTHSTALADPATHALDLRVRGPLSDDAVFVTADTAPTYWQGAVYDHYDGTSWTTTATQPSVAWTVTQQGAAAVQDAPAVAQGSAGSAGVSRTDSVHVVSPSPLAIVFAPGRATSYAGPGTVEADGNGNLRLVGTPRSAADYQVTSVHPASSAQALASTTGADPSDQRWLQLPGNLPARVTQLANQVAGQQPTRAAAVNAVEAYLRSHETYDLSAPVPAPGADAVDDFLFNSHRGFCEQFASAAVVMLRGLRIPARLVTGYAHGDTTSDPGTTVMRQSDAHAWVQVWYPGIGWVGSDPTAGSVLGSPVASTALPASSAAVRKYRTLTSVAALLVGAMRDAWHSSLGIAAGLALALTLGLVSGVSLVRRRHRHTSPSAPTPSTRDEGGPVLDAYLRLEGALFAQGHAAGETLRESANRLAVATPVMVSLDPALELLERECYGREPLSRAETDAAVTTFDALASVAAGNRPVIDLDVPVDEAWLEKDASISA